ncbi:MAG: DUF2330 domain-containing protein [Polyangiales bacterium]|nr:DUF2330 domain-containing protein [Myxococcales bacterium]
MRIGMRTLLALVGCLGAAALSAPNVAQACGGFFCNSASPVNQQAERIVFAKGDDGKVTAIIEIKYAGPSNQFAWMLPVSGKPTVRVSSTAALDRLQAQTNPQYTLNTIVEGTCRDDLGFFGTGVPGSSDNARDGGTALEGDGSGVSVVDRGSVGPYDYVILAVDASETDKVGVAVEWLSSRGYDVNEFGSDRLKPYLDAGMNLLTFKLSKGFDSGAIRPVMLEFGSGLPAIPLRPTAVAATNDMGVLVWVLAETRAVPANYLSLELNEALINWFSPGLTYNAVVTRAANEAGGQGFVTEFAGDANAIDQAVFPDFLETQWATIKRTDWTNREGELLSTVIGAFGPNADGTRDVFAENLVPPDGISLDEFLSCVFCYLDYGTTDIQGFEPAKFLTDFDKNVAEPLKATQELLRAQAYVTRLYTTMSPDEMTKDPMFDFNADLPSISNVHTADRIIECSPEVDRSDASWRVKLANGQVVRGRGSQWPFAADDEGLPANERTVRLGTEGEGEVVDDNIRVIAAALSDHNAGVPSTASSAGGSGLCSTKPGSGERSAGLGFAGLLALGMFVAARRRRGR